jgi:hypothetical protein
MGASRVSEGLTYELVKGLIAESPKMMESSDPSMSSMYFEF